MSAFPVTILLELHPAKQSTYDGETHTPPGREVVKNRWLDKCGGFVCLEKRPPRVEINELTPPGRKGNGGVQDNIPVEITAPSGIRGVHAANVAAGIPEVVLLSTPPLSLVNIQPGSMSSLIFARGVVCRREKDYPPDLHPGDRFFREFRGR